MNSPNSAAPDSYLHFDARLIEEAVLLRITGHPEERTFRRMRDRIYEIDDAEERERRFRQFHADWFLRLKLHRPLATAFHEQPLLMGKTRSGAVTSAASRQDEGADLHGVRPQQDDAGDQRPVAVIKLRANTLLDEAALLPFVRHELMHLVDMLDPGFGYEPLLPQSGFGSGHDNLIRERYRVLWDTWIDGRLERRGWTPPVVREKRWTQFVETFPFLGAEALKTFTALYESDSQTHRALVALAVSPAAGGRRTDGKPQAGVCPLCRFPTYHFAVAADLPSAVLDEIASEHPGWQTDQGLCDQCAEIYRARSSSRAYSV